jgi:3-deoxy-D-manno-octulosonic-acid transferase/heptosyltransferase-1
MAVLALKPAMEQRMKILIVKLSAIGDVVHTLPALNAMRAHYPHAHITWLVEEDASDLVLGHPALDRVIISRRKRWLGAFRGSRAVNKVQEAYGFVKELRDTRYDLIIDFQALLKSSVLIALSRGDRKVGFGRGMEHMEGSYLFLNEPIPAVDMEIHALERGLMLLQALGIPSNTVSYHLPIRTKDRDEVDSLLTEHGLADSKLLVAINPVAKWETKLWSNQKFRELAHRLAVRYGADVVFTGSLHDRPTIEKITSVMEGAAINLAGKTTLMTLAALYERCRFVVSTDTGPMHLAAAAGTPVVALFGPTAPWRTGPFGPEHQVIRVGLECSPCFKRKCDTRACMEQITVDGVFGEIKKLDL